MTIYKISEARQRNDINGRAGARAYIERASTFTMCYPTAIALNAVAGDTPIGIVPYDCEFLGGYLEVSGDEGVNGAIVIEKWVSIVGAQTSISAAVAIDAGAASIEALAAVTDGEEVCPAGYKIVLKRTTATGNAVTGILTLYFKTVDDIGRSG